VDDYSVSNESLFLNAVAAHPLLSAPEEIELAKRMEAGRSTAGSTPGDGLYWTVDDSQDAAEAGAQARNRLIESNLRLVVSIARRHLGHGLELMDLVQEGSIGLQIAADKFDWRRGCRFSTHAYWWIQQAIQRANQNHGRVVRLPTHVIAGVTKVNRARSSLSQELGREPKAVDIARHLSMEPDQVRELIHFSNPLISLETPLGKDEPRATLGDVITDRMEPTPPDSAALALLAEGIAVALEALSPRQRLILRLRFGLHDGYQYALADIGKQLGVSGERIRQVEEEALTTLREQSDLRHQLVEYAAA
jgi:RNA polymerase primary sigma factor